MHTSAPELDRLVGRKHPFGLHLREQVEVRTQRLWVQWIPPPWYTLQLNASVLQKLMALNCTVTIDCDDDGGGVRVTTSMPALCGTDTAARATSLPASGGSDGRSLVAVGGAAAPYVLFVISRDVDSHERVLKRMRFVHGAPQTPCRSGGVRDCSLLTNAPVLRVAAEYSRPQRSTSTSLCRRE